MREKGRGGEGEGGDTRELVREEIQEGRGVREKGRGG